MNHSLPTLYLPAISLLLTACGGADISDNVVNNYIEENNIVNNFYDTPVSSESSATEETASTPILLTNLSDIENKSLDIGDTVKFNFSDGHLSKLTGTEVTKIGTGQFEHFLVNLVNDSGVRNTSILSTESLHGYLEAVNTFHDGGTPDDNITTFYSASLDEVGYSYTLFENNYDGSRKRSGIAVKDEQGRGVVATAYNEFYDLDGNISASTFTNHNLLAEFVPPTGNFEYNGTVFLQKTGSDNVYTGDVNMKVNFDSGTGSFSAPELAHENGAFVAAVSGNYELLQDTGLFIGTSQATILGENFTGGGVAGSFDSKANVATAGIAKWDAYAGSFVVQKSR